MLGVVHEDLKVAMGIDVEGVSPRKTLFGIANENWLPYYVQICGWIHKNTSWKCSEHSCGSVARFYDSLMEAGRDCRGDA